MYFKAFFFSIFYIYLDRCLNSVKTPKGTSSPQDLPILKLGIYDLPFEGSSMSKKIVTEKRTDATTQCDLMRHHLVYIN